MTRRPAHAPPLRFLALVVGGWIGLRAAVLAPGWWSVERASPPPTVTAPAPATAGRAAPDGASRPGRPDRAARQLASTVMTRVLIRNISYKARPRSGALWPLPGGGTGRSAATRPPVPPVPLVPLAPSTPLPPPPLPNSAGPPGAATAANRWSSSAWLLARREPGEPALVPGGTLGGSQAGARVLYRVNGDPARPLALAGRLYVPLRRAAGAEVAAGVDWQPAALLPVHILAERREALGGEGRSAVALTLYGGISRPLPHRLRVDAYGQAGVVGLHARDLFVDGSARVAAPAGPVEIGAAAWGAAQPGAARLDAGPEVSVRIHAGPAALRLSADWRFRVAGDAAPDSGPALTLAADF